ncbi:MAG: type I glutamate--ammonia ligase [Trueperaceae bacterium]|nr:type I glutamate--ammonia ligase [Trueperaceae bacterium]
MFESAQELVSFLNTEDVALVDIRFTDVNGRWQHFTVPSREFDEDTFEEGLGFDGSSIQGFQQIEASDMLLLPDATSAFLDPFTQHKTLVVIADIADPISGELYGKDPRGVAKRAEAYLRETGVADTSFMGPEAEFFIFDEVAFNDNPYNYGYRIRAEDAHTDGDAFGDGYWVRPKSGYFPCAPSDKYQDLRSEMVINLEKIGVEIELHHHEVATAGQGEIDMRFDTLTTVADKIVKYKYAIRNTAALYGKTVTFMPKPIFGDNGSGMHTHQSLWKDGEPLFFDKDGYAGLSKLAMHYVAGLLTHGPALAALTNPSVNSYRRLVPGYEAPVNLIISARNRSAVVRVPMYSNSPKAKRVEYRAPDPTANPYLAFAAMLMAGLDGIKRELEPPKPVDKNLYTLSAREARRIKQLPRNLEEALDALEKDQDFLLEGGVFTPDLLESYVELKRGEVDETRLRPAPIEYTMYFDL